MELSIYTFYQAHEKTPMNPVPTTNTNGKVCGGSNKIKTIRIIHELFREKVLPNGIDTSKKSLPECYTLSI